MREDGHDEANNRQFCERAKKTNQLMLCLDNLCLFCDPYKTYNVLILNLAVATVASRYGLDGLGIEFRWG